MGQSESPVRGCCHRPRMTLTNWGVRPTPCRLFRACKELRRGRERVGASYRYAPIRRSTDSRHYSPVLLRGGDRAIFASRGMPTSISSPIVCVPIPISGQPADRCQRDIARGVFRNRTDRIDSLSDPSVWLPARPHGHVLGLHGSHRAKSQWFTRL